MTDYDLDSEMKDVSESARYLKMLIYGDPKVGKTTFAGTAPAPLFLAVEPGTVVFTKNEENRKRFADIKTVTVPTWARLSTIIDQLRLGKAPDRKTVVLDSLTEFEDRILSQYMDYAMSKGLTKNDNKYNPEWPEYKAVTAILKKSMWELRDLERHVVVICHCRDDADKTRGGMSVDRPALMPKLASSLAAMFNLIGYMEVNPQGIHTMRVVPTPNVVAGNHIWDGPPIIENPTFDMFLLERALADDVRST